MSEPRKVNAHAWDLEENEHYVEPRWVGRRICEVEEFDGYICDPCCGLGNMLEGAAEAGISESLLIGYDVVNRGSRFMVRELDFLAVRGDWLFQNIITNPPFGPIRQFVEQACRLATGKVAIVCPTRRLNAAGAWLRHLPLARVYYLTPRPSMPPGDVYLEMLARGETPGGGKQDFCVLVFYRGRGSIEPTVHWLHRDGGWDAP